MTAAFSSIGAWWEGRSLRERQMLGLMLGLILCVAVWLGTVRPLDAWKDDQARALAVAEQRLARINSAVLQQGEPRPQVADLQALVRETADAAGVQPTLGMSEGARLGFRLDSVTTAQAFGWLEALTTGGARIEELGVVKNIDGTLGVTGALASGA